MKLVLLIGLGNFGLNVAKQIKKLGHQVMAVDSREERVNAALPYVTDAIIGDSQSELFLKTLGVSNYDVCIVTIGDNFQSSLETTSLLAELGAKKVVSRAYSEVQAKFLLRNGADEVVNPEKQVAEWTAIRYTADHILDYIKLDDTHSIYEVNVPAEWLNKEIDEVDVRRKHGINIIAVKKNGQLNLAVHPDMVLTTEISLLVTGEEKAIKKCFRL